ncbi:kinesin, putative [Babesia bigemina]|uniref:Kinesin-like protein n=1 Tax=Babesia bigemina TaxID=5866 RepID=A0A061D776_BABBI|nr:kinesin, putative [Babesia bigemina]CDR94764.1 kinesin, putative [Babesia bigemina]|eukprot:XP_012766950.1 kinesin, putative [Babesia bigemina]
MDLSAVVDAGRKETADASCTSASPKRVSPSGRIALRLVSPQGRPSAEGDSAKPLQHVQDSNLTQRFRRGMDDKGTPKRVARNRGYRKLVQSTWHGALDGAPLVSDLAVNLKSADHMDTAVAEGSSSDGAEMVAACSTMSTPTKCAENNQFTTPMIATSRSCPSESRIKRQHNMESRLPSPTHSIARDDALFLDCESHKEVEEFLSPMSVDTGGFSSVHETIEIRQILESYYTNQPCKPIEVDGASQEDLPSVDRARDNTPAECAENIKVVVRVRPIDDNGIPAIRLVDNVVEVHKPGNVHSVLESQRPKVYRYGFDSAFDGGASQQDIYEATAKDLVPKAFEGINGTVFAYGCTSAGKTYTMIGDEKEEGIVQLSLKSLFELRQELYPDALVHFSFMQVYNECVFDLLTTGNRQLDVQEDNGEVRVPHLTVIRVDDCDSVLVLLAKGIKARKMAMTDANRQSSRSHAIMQITVSTQHTTARLSFVDLAGSERAGEGEARAERLKESSYINQSLLALANCISGLADTTSRKARIKYRDSKLTLLLKNALFNNAAVVMITAIHPGSQFMSESSNSLKYAQRAKEVKVALEAPSAETEEADYAAALKEAYTAIAHIGQMLPESVHNAVIKSLRASPLSGKHAFVSLLKTLRKPSHDTHS